MCKNSWKFPPRITTRNTLIPTEYTIVRITVVDKYNNIIVFKYIEITDQTMTKTDLDYTT